jgi:hypothetical protein
LATVKALQQQRRLVRRAEIEAARAMAVTGLDSAGFTLLVCVARLLLWLQPARRRLPGASSAPRAKTFEG